MLSPSHLHAGTTAGRVFACCLHRCLGKSQRLDLTHGFLGSQGRHGLAVVDAVMISMAAAVLGEVAKRTHSHPAICGYSCSSEARSSQRAGSGRRTGPRAASIHRKAMRHWQAKRYGEKKRMRREYERLYRQEYAESELQRRVAKRVTPVWDAVKKILTDRELQCDSGEESKAFRRFFKHVTTATVDGSTLSAGGTALGSAYMQDKFIDRADTMASACVQWWEAGLQASGSRLCKLLRRWSRHPPSTLRVASVAGGPGNDATGFAIFNSEVLHTRKVSLDIFDISESWQQYCGAAMAAVKAECSEGGQVSIVSHFGLADLHQSLRSAVNAPLRFGEYDVVLLSYCVYESRACNETEHPLLQELLEQSSEGTMFVVLDAYPVAVQAVMELLRRQQWTVRQLKFGPDEVDGNLEGQSRRPGPVFETVALGGSADFPFSGVLIYKVNDGGRRLDRKPAFDLNNKYPQTRYVELT